MDLTSNGNSVVWIVVVFLGAFALMAAIAYGVAANKRTSKADLRRTEQATRDLYDGDPVDRTKS